MFAVPRSDPRVASTAVQATARPCLSTERPDPRASPCARLARTPCSHAIWNFASASMMAFLTAPTSKSPLTITCAREVPSCAET
eukprot:1609433-Prymnesium_polylepis.1